MTAVDPLHRSNLAKSPGGSLLEGRIQADQSDLVAVCVSPPNSESPSDMRLNGKAFNAVAVLFYCGGSNNTAAMASPCYVGSSA